MSTRCIIAEPYGDGWRGRYSHWDGSPETKVPQLIALVKRDGVEQVRQVLLHDHYSWSHINPDYTKCETQWESVEGYGEAHNDGQEHWFTQSDGEFGWAEYLYILADGMIIVCQAIGDTDWDKMSTVSYLNETITI